MQIRDLHPWSLDYRAAVALQEKLRERLVARTLPKKLHTVAGADVSYSKGSDVLYAAVVVLALPSLEHVEEVAVKDRATFPYIPGLLSFREGPAVIAAFRRLRTTPDAVIFDGQGIAHPRRFGLAAHMGVWLGVPTVGCAKTRLIGEYREPGRTRGTRLPLTIDGEPVGAVVRTRTDVTPVFVSPGQYMTIDGAVELVLRCGGGRRIPEPTRLAHIAVNRLRRACEEPGQKPSPSRGGRGVGEGGLRK